MRAAQRSALASASARVLIPNPALTDAGWRPKWVQDVARGPRSRWL
jgi:hypothetical protein